MGGCSFPCRVADPAVFSASYEAAGGKQATERQETSHPQNTEDNERSKAAQEQKAMSIPPNQTPESQAMDEMAMMIRKLAQALRKAAPEHDLPQKALDYLKRKGLQGRVFRG